MVDDLAVINSIVFHTRANIVPGFICSDHLDFPIFIDQTKLRDQLKGITKIIALAVQSKFSFVPAISQRYSQLVFCCFLHFCMVIDIFDIFHDIKCKILFFIVIIAVIRSQNFLPDFFSI